MMWSSWREENLKPPKKVEVNPLPRAILATSRFILRSVFVEEPYEVSSYTKHFSSFHFSLCQRDSIRLAHHTSTQRSSCCC